MGRDPQGRAALLELPEEFAKFVKLTQANFELVNTRLERLEADVTELKNDVAQMKEGQTELTASVAGLRRDMAPIRGPTPGTAPSAPPGASPAPSTAGSSRYSTKTTSATWIDTKSWPVGISLSLIPPQSCPNNWVHLSHQRHQGLDKRPGGSYPGCADNADLLRPTQRPGPTRSCLKFLRQSDR